MSEQIVEQIEQRFLYEFLLPEAGIEDSMCIGVSAEEIAWRLLRGDCVGFASHPNGLETAVLPQDPNADRVSASDMDLGPGWKFERFLHVPKGKRADAVLACRQALAISVSRAFATDELPEDLHTSEAQVLLLQSGLPWEPWDINTLLAAAVFGAGAGRELNIEEAKDLVMYAERRHLEVSRG